MDPEPPSLDFFQALDSNLIFGYIGIFVLLFFAAIVSGAEITFFSLSQKDLDNASINNPRKARIIAKLLEKPKRLLATLGVANNFITISVVVLFLILDERLFGFISTPLLRLFAEIVLITFLILFFVEVLPKIYASRNNLKFAMVVAGAILVLDKLLLPISLPMQSLTVFLQKKLGKQKASFSADQLSHALELTSSEGTSSKGQKILEGIVSFGNTDAKQIMSPRIDIFALDIDETFQEIFPKIVDKGFSRIPIYRDNIDHIEGILYVKDLIPHIDKKEFDWKVLIRAPFFVPENKKLDNLLKDFQGMKSHLAIVVDEYGVTSGLVSLEDVIEEIVGDISDEFDDEDINFSQIDEKNFLFEGKIYLKDFYRIVTVNEEVFEDRRGDAETLAGLILEVLGNFPKKGQKVNLDDCIFTIETVDKKRIKQVKVTLN